MMVSFVLSFFPRDVLDEILNLIESVSEDFPSYSCIEIVLPHGGRKSAFHTLPKLADIEQILLMLEVLFEQFLRLKICSMFFSGPKPILFFFNYLFDLGLSLLKITFSMTVLE